MLASIKGSKDGRGARLLTIVCIMLLPCTAVRRLGLVLLPVLSVVAAADTTRMGSRFDVRDDLHFPLHARASNKDGSPPLYKNPNASIEDRVSDLLPRMTLEEKVAQMYAMVLLCALTSY